MSDNSDYLRTMRQRLDRIQRDNDAADALAEQHRVPSLGPASPVTPTPRPSRRKGRLFIAALLLNTFVFAELALTVQGWSSPDFDDAQRLGKATVVSCERRGPVGRGIGYWDRCTADVVWDGGFSSRSTFDRRNFIHADEVGSTFTIGRNTGARGGGTTYSRPQAPHRPAAVALGVVLAVISAIPALFLLAAVFSAARNALRRTQRRCRHPGRPDRGLRGRRRPRH